MRILTLNCNGVRSAASKGLFDWLPSQAADVVCLQETKAQEHQLGDSQVVRADTLERRQQAVEHVVAAAEVAAAIDRDQVGG